MSVPDPDTAPVYNGKPAARYRSYPIDECRITLSTPAVSGTSDFRWTGGQIKPTVTVVHVPTGRTVSGYTTSYGTNTDAGISTGYVTITGQYPTSASSASPLTSSNGTSRGVQTVYFNIKYDMDEYSVQWTGQKATTPQVVYTHTGNPVGSAALMRGSIAVPTAHYTRAYTNNTNPGDLTAVFDATIPSSVASRWLDSTKARQVKYSIRKAPIITTTTGPHNNALRGKAYSLQLEADGYSKSPDAIVWSATALPPGLSLNTATGLISGTPTTPGTYSVTITARNIAGSNSKVFTWVIGDYAGSVWNDRNHNGQKDPGEMPIRGITAQALRPGTNIVLASSTTDQFGCFSLTGFSETTIDVRFVTSNPAKYRVIGDSVVSGVTKGTQGINKGFDIATTIILNAGEQGGFDGSPTKVITGFQGDELILVPGDLNMQITFGYRIEGWYLDEEHTQLFDNVWPVDDAELYAKYDQRIYTVEYSTGPDAEDVEPKALLLWEDKNLLPAPDPYRPGYRLVEWRSSLDNTQVVTSDTTYAEVVKDDRYVTSVVLDAVWEERHDIKVVLDANGSLGAPATINGEASETHTDLTYNDYLNYSPPIREGYTFTGWSESKSYDPVNDPNPTMSLKVPGRDVTYYATWEAENIGVIFDVTGGSFADGEDGMRNGLPGDQYTLPDNPERPGFTFKGWYETPAGASQVYAPEDQHGNIPNGKTYYFAQWSPSIVTVTLEAEKSTPITQSHTGLSGSAVEFEFPTRAGHSFLGWDVDGETVMFISYPAEDTTYQAVWAVGNNTIAYNPMGGTFVGAENGIRQGNTGDSYTIPSDPVREGHVFAGWYLTPEYLEEAPDDGIVPPESVSYYAKWELADINAYLYSEDAFFASASGKFGSVIEYTIPTKPNATFVGWKLHGAADATATTYPTFSAVDNQRYDAVFRDGEVSVIYNAAGGTFNSDDGIRVGVSGDSYSVPAAPARPGYEFSGWFDAATGGNRVHDLDQKEALFPSDTNTVYYAQYRSSEITVTLDAGSDANPPVQQYSGAYQSSVPYNEPFRDGYVFAGWKEEGTLDSTAVKNLTFPAEEKTYYAVWLSGVVEVHYEAMGGTIVSGSATQSGYPGTSYELPRVEYEGNLFLGWYDRPVGGTQLFDPTTEKALIPPSNTSYYAHWAPVEVSATLNAGSGAEPSTQVVSGYFDTLIGYTLPVKAGHAFIGWKLEGSDDSTATMTPRFKGTDGLVYVAVWTAGQSSVSYDPQNGSFASGESGVRTGNTGDAYTPPLDPTRKGYVFGGWFTQPDGQGSPYTSTTFPTETNTTVYALWNAQTYEVALDLNYTDAPEPEKKTGLIEQEVPYEMPVRDGFAFLGWSTTVDGSSGDTNYFPRFADGLTKLYAQWRADNVTLQFNPVAGAFIGGESGYRSGKATLSYSIPMNPVRPGYTFTGWFTDIYEGTQVFPDGLYPAESAIYYAQWSADVIAVNLDLNYEGAPAPSTVTGICNEKIDYEHSERVGYTFVGWSTDAQATEGNLHPIFPAETDLTLYAVWAPRTITVTYDAMGGSFADGSVAEHSGAPGDAYEIPVATSDGRNFEGWFTTPLGQTEAPSDGIIPTDDKIYYAQWSEGLIEVTLYLTGGTVDGSGAAQKMSGIHGETIEWKTPERTGYRFIGWKVSGAADTTATRFLAYPDKDASYEAVWETLEDVQVIYDPYGGEVDGSSVFSGKPGASYEAPNVKDRDDFTFEGWAVQPTDDYADHQAGDEMTYSEDASELIYYAKWKADTCTLTLEFEDGSTPAQEVTGPLGALIDYANFLPAREGYVFTGWGDAPDATTHDLFPRYAKEREGAILYAQWDPAGLMVAFFAQGSISADAVIEGKVGENYTVIADPVRDGYEFKGWFSDRNGGGYKLEAAAGDPVAFEQGMTVAWYASWERMTSTVILDANGGTIEGQGSVSKTGDVGDAVSYSMPTRDGYEFAGWTLDGGATTSFSPVHTTDVGITYKAVWAANEVTLTFTAMGGTFADAEDGIRQGKVDDSFVMPADPSRPGYVFGGWYLDTEGNTPAPVLDKLPVSDTQFYAKWTPATVTVQMIAVGSNLEMQTLTGSYGDYIYYQAPYIAGKTFIGWKNTTTGVTQLNPTYPEVATIYEAVFSEGAIIVSFDPAGGRYINVSGLGADSGIRTGEKGETRDVPSADSLIRDGYAFKGWFTASNGGQEIGSGGTFEIPTISTTYYAHWEAVEVTVTLDPDNGEPTQTKKGLHGEAINYNIPEKDNATFIGWDFFDEPTADGATMFPVFDESLNNATYKGVWSTEFAAVTFFAMGGASDASFMPAIGEKVSVPADPKLDGYHFEGWFDEPVGGANQNIQAGDEIEITALGNITYYAHYVPRADLKITLDAGTGATPSIQEKTGALGDELTYDIPVKEGHTFKGWKLRTDPVQPDDTAQTVIHFSQDEATYDAVWRVNDITYTFEVNGGDSIDDKTRKGSTDDTFDLPSKPTRDGYEFAGWYTLNVGGTLVFEADATQGVFGASDATYYAAWNPIGSSVKFHASGGAFADATNEKVFEGKFGELVEYEIPTLAGWAFAGWSTTFDNSSNDATTVINYTKTQTVYYAHWAQNQVSAVFKAEGGTFADSNETAIRIGIANDPYEAPELVIPREGYDFGGWWTQPNGGGTQLSDPPTFTTSDTTVYYAYWIGSDLEATLNANEGAIGGNASKVVIGKPGTAIEYGEIPQRPGYGFMGWSADKTATTGNTTPVFGTTDITLYAIWDAQAITLDFQPMGGVRASGSSALTVAGKTGDFYTVPTVERKGYTFKRWHDAPLGNLSDAPNPGAVGMLLKIPGRNQTFYALWEANEHTTTLVANGGSFTDTSTSKPVIGNQGALVPVLPNYEQPTNPGYSFRGWSTSIDGSSGVSMYATVDVDVTTLYAIWAVNEVTVTYNPSGGSGGGTVVQDAGSTYATIPGSTPARAGYTFTGWFNDPFDSSLPHPDPVGGVYTVPNDDTTWFAQWEAAAINLTLDANGGAFADSEGTKVYPGVFGENVDYEIPVREGYLFKGWNLDGSVTRSITYPSQNKTYLAEWEPVDQVSVTYEIQGGTMSTGSTSFTGLPGSLYAANTVASLTREGYTFAGWFSEPDGAGDPHPLVDNGSYTFPRVSTVWYAHWNVVPINITFDPAGGTIGGQTDPVARSGEIDTAVPYDIPQREGYAFMGWAESKDASTGDMFPQFTTALDTKTLYALWRADGVSAVFFSCGGTFADGVDPVQVGQVGETYTVPTDPVWTGYTFIGWFEDADYNKPAEIEAGEAIEYPSDAGFVPYWAKWTANEAKITFDAQGGKMGTDSTVTITGFYGEVAAYELPVKEGYFFAGWNIDKDASSGVMSLTFSDADQSYYAIWTPQTITVAFDSMLGTIEGTDVHQGVPGSAYSVPNAKRSGYTFKGWATTPYAMAIDGPKAGTNATIPTTGIVYFAQWEENIIKVTFNLNGGNVNGAMSNIEMTGYAGEQVKYAVPQKNRYTFIGWRIAGESDDTAEMYLSFPTKNTSYYAVWRHADLNYVNYYAMDGTVNGHSSYNNNETSQYTSPSATPPVGYTFAGWSLSPESDAIDHRAGESKTIGTESVKNYYAVYVARADISVTLDPSGGILDGSTSPKVLTNQTYGTKVHYNLPTRDGFHFVGWATDSEATAGNMDLSVSATDETYYAIWIEGGFDELLYVTYVGNGGEVSGDTLYSGYEGDTYNAPDVQPRTGYDFLGWTTSPASTVIDHNAGEKKTFAADQHGTYYAVWQVKSDITVRLNVNGGTWDGTATDDQIMINQVFGTPLVTPTPQRVDHLFMGWSTAQDATYGDPNIVVPDQETTYYAVWLDINDPQRTTYAFYDAAGGVVDGRATIEGIASSGYTAPDAQRAGHIFKGWSKTVNGTIDHEVGAAVSLPETGSVHYYALWETRADITITLDPAGGSLSGGTQLFGQVYASTITPETPVRTGYLFTGWKPSDNSLPASAAIVVGEYDATYIATWISVPTDAQRSIVYYDGMGGTVSVATPLEGEIGDPYTAPSVTRTGFIFKGWSKAPSGAVDHNAGAAKNFSADAQTVYYALWQSRSDITLTMILENGQPDQIYTGKEAGTLFFPDTPLYDGHVFVGWVKDGVPDEQPSSGIVVPEVNSIYRAVWHEEIDPADLRVVLFDTQGGSLANGAASIVLGGKGSIYTLPSLEERAGYTFEGWEYDGDVYQPGTTHSHDDSILQKTYVAQWRTKQVTVALSAIGSDIENQTLEGVYGTAVAYEVPYKVGETFMGWKITGADDSTAQRDLLFPQSDCTYEAVWKVSGDVDVTYDLRGGTDASNSTDPVVITGKHGNSYAVPSGLYRSGYSFAGWFEMPGGEGVVHPEIDPMGMTTFPGRTTFWYAAWDIVPVTVTMHANGGTIEGQESVEMKGLLDSFINYGFPERPGYSFVGWATTPDATSGSMNPAFEQQYDNETFYAVWKAGYSSAAFMANGGIGDALMSGKTGETYVVPADPTRVGYRFAGWHDAPEGGNKIEIKSGDVLTYTDAANTAYWAHWDPNTVVVTLDGSAHKGILGEKVDYDAPVREGYTFRGWSENKNATSGSMSLTFPLTDTTYYSVWSANTVVVTFDATGGSLQGQAEFAGTYGSSYSAPQNPARNGYTFRGWSTKVAGSVDQTIGVFPSRNIVYYAQWDSSSSVISPTAQGSSGRVIGSAGSTHGSSSASGSAGSSDRGSSSGSNAAGGGKKDSNAKFSGITADFTLMFTLEGGTVHLLNASENPEDKTFLFVPENGYRLASVVVDGKEVEVDASDYTYANMRGEHTIDARFILDNPTPWATFEFAARYSPLLWLIPTTLVVVIGAGAVGLSTRRKRQTQKDATKA